MKHPGKLTAGPLVFVVLFFGMLSAACSGDGSNAPRDQALVGNWQAGEGDLFAYFPGVEFLVLQFRDDSNGVAVFQEPESKALACADLIYTRLSEQTLFIDVETFNEASAFLPKSFTYVVDDDALTLRDNVGRSQTFTKLDEMPAGAQCENFSEVVVVGEIEADPVSGTGLVWDGFSLWFGARADPYDQLVPVDPATGEAEAPVDLPSGTSEVQAHDGLRLWFGTAVGYIASLRTFADTELGTLDTDLDLGHKLFIDAMAMADGDLWLSGESDVSGLNELLQVDPNAKTLVNQYVFSAELDALTWDGAYFWGLVDGSPSPLVQIDPGTLQVVNTYELPGYDIFFSRYVGIAAADGDLYVLLENWTGDPDTATILRATP